MKNYIGFVNDHSGSMCYLTRSAIKDYNANILAIKDSATREMLDTVVSVCEIGGHSELTVTVSNPHVLKPITQWRSAGGTPLWSGTVKLIKMLDNMPDIGKHNVSVLVMITTDGEDTENGLYFNELAQLIKERQATGRWTFVVRAPSNLGFNAQNTIKLLGIPSDNVQKWETTAAGMAASTVVTTQAMSSYFAGRAAGQTSTGSFYANAAAVNLAALDDVSKKVSLYVVDPLMEGIEIRDFILKHRMEYLKGAAFYQLTKTEAKVSHLKQILVREQATGKIYAGAQARQMIGLPTDRNARLHPGDHKNFDLFIQSESVNRKLVGGSGVVYWKEIGVPFTEADLAYLQPKPVVVAPVVAQLVKVPLSIKPTKSPIPVIPKVHYFETREDARDYCRANGFMLAAIQNAGKAAPQQRRWFI